MIPHFAAHVQNLDLSASCSCWPCSLLPLSPVDALLWSALSAKASPRALPLGPLLGQASAVAAARQTSPTRPMADNASSEPSSRRASFRKTVTEASLPQDYLDSLEQKRRQLDESIHKYIAAKEREYKVYERELRLQWKTTPPDSNKDGEQRRAPSSAASGLPVSASLNRDHRDGGQQAEEEANGRAHNHGISLAERNDAQTANRSAGKKKQEHDQELVGLFTPAFLPALGNSTVPSLARSSSEPRGSEPAAEAPAPDFLKAAAPSTSDPSSSVKSKRPAQLQLAHRTSSSGSSADGKLASAMKSPTQPTKPKRKRVSLAVGDVIVAPSDSVPVAMSHNTTPSHSRTRSPVTVPQSATMNAPEPLIAASSPGTDKDVQTNGRPLPLSSDVATTTTATPVPIEQPSAKTASKIDPDGDLFDLEDGDLSQASDGPKFGNPFESDDDVLSERDGDATVLAQPAQSSGERYDEDAGLVPEYDEEEEHVEFGPSSSTASQQPTSPGFRRPSVSMDPVYTGNDWTRAEREAAVNEVYGSSYARQTGKGSFAAGSLGESYMARNSENLMRSRGDQERPQART